MIKLNDRAWGYFKVSDFFKIYSGGDKPKVITGSIKVASVENLTTNNGIKEVILTNGDKVFSNFISIVSIGGGGTAFYHKYDSSVYTRVKALIPKFDFLNEYNAIFLTVILNLEKFKYSYGRVVTNNKIAETVLKLPITELGDPDWQFMEDYIKQFEETKLLEIQETNYKDNVKLPSVDEWGSYRLSDLFEIEIGYYHNRPKDNANFGIPYVSSSENNNGISAKFSIDTINDYNSFGKDSNTINGKIFNSETITIAMGGSVGSSFYHEYEYTAYDAVAILNPKFKINKFIGLFVSKIIEMEKYKYSYGRMWNQRRIRDSLIKLPVDDNGEPDWILIERYMRSLPYSEMI